MGYQVLIDIAAAMMIGGTLILTLQSLNQSVIFSTFTYTGDAVLQSNLITIVNQVESDMRRIGYTQNPALIPIPSQAILKADTSEIRFRGDVDNNGTVDTVRYYIGSLSELSSTKNPRDRILYRSINGAALPTPYMGITEFSLRYFDALTNQLATPINTPLTGAIATIQISVRVQSPDSINQNYSTAYWRQIRIAAKNLSNR